MKELKKQWSNISSCIIRKGNKMRLKDDVYYLQQELDGIKQESIAMEMLKDYKKQNKRLFIITVLAMLLLAVTFGYLVYILNDIEVEEVMENITTMENTMQEEEIEDIVAMTTWTG